MPPFSIPPVSAEHQLAHRRARFRQGPSPPRPSSHSASCRATAPEAAPRGTVDKTWHAGGNAAPPHIRTRDKANWMGPTADEHRPSGGAWIHDRGACVQPPRPGLPDTGQAPRARPPGACLFCRLGSKQAQSRPVCTDASRLPTPARHIQAGHTPLNPRGMAAPSSPITCDCGQVGLRKRACVGDRPIQYHQHSSHDSLPSYVHSISSASRPSSHSTVSLSSPERP